MDRHWRRLRLGVIAGDVLAVILAYTLAAGARLGSGEIRLAGLRWPVYLLLAVAVAVLTVTLGWQLGIYRRLALFGGYRVYPAIATVATYGVLTVIVLSYFGGGPPLVSRRWPVAAWFGAIACLSLGRLLWRQVALWARSRGWLVRKVLLAGANQQGIAVAEQLHNPRLHGTQVLGFLDDYQRPGTEVVAGLTVVGHPVNVLEQAAALGADEVIIVGGALAWESQRMLAELVTRADSPLEARISPTFYDLLTTSAELSHIGLVPMLSLSQTRLSGLNGVAKGLMDRVCAAVLLVLLAPVWAYWRAKAWVRGVPMLERRPVLGVEGRPFNVVGLNRQLEPYPVVARLPAVWNVLRNDMSLVGPRPMLLDELRAHEPWLANLCAMRSGLTGLWRLRGRELPVEERVALDLFYIRQYSVTLDLQILVQTARELARRLLGWEDRLARWEEPEAGSGAEAGTTSVADDSIPRAEPVVEEKSTRSVWIRP
jgi:lipopolysaccharide/colanic/teichoic acid biosynthesis glycosyltransferase